jgi:hypothetical protein
MSNVTFAGEGVPLDMTEGYKNEIGGAVLIENVQTVALTTVSITGFEASYGGGMAILTDPIEKGIHTDFQVALDYLEIEGCTAKKQGGGLYLRFPREVKITNSRIEKNTAVEEGGGI